MIVMVSQRKVGHVLAVLLLAGTLPKAAHATVINFDTLAIGEVVTTQYTGLTFSSTAGKENRILGDAAPFGSSPPNHLESAIAGGPFTGLDETIVDFAPSVVNLQFVGTAVNTNGRFGSIDVTYDNGIRQATVGVFGDGTTQVPDRVDLSAFRAVTRIRIYELTDPGGTAWDDFDYGTLGDFDGDGDLDLADYSVLRTNLLVDVTALTVVQSFSLGDLTADLHIDGRDFVEFRTAYDVVNGVGAFAAILQAIPEPSTLWLAALGVSLLAWRCRR